MTGAAFDGASLLAHGDGLCEHRRQHSITNIIADRDAAHIALASAYEMDILLIQP